MSQWVIVWSYRISACINRSKDGHIVIWVVIGTSHTDVVINVGIVRDCLKGVSSDGEVSSKNPDWFLVFIHCRRNASCLVLVDRNNFIDRNTFRVDENESGTPAENWFPLCPGVSQERKLCGFRRYPSAADERNCVFLDDNNQEVQDARFWRISPYELVQSRGSHL